MIKENQKTLNQINGLTDVLILFPCMALAYFIRFHIFNGEPGHIGLSYYMYAALCITPLFWLLLKNKNKRIIGACAGGIIACYAAFLLL